MRFHVTLTTLLILAVFAQTACDKKSGGSNQTDERAQASPQPSTTPPPDGVRRISIRELQDAMEKGEAVAVDVRGQVEYNLGHIKGSLSVPLGLIRQRAGELPREKLLVTYCA